MRPYQTDYEQFSENSDDDDEEETDFSDEVDCDDIDLHRAQFRRRRAPGPKKLYPVNDHDDVAKALQVNFGRIEKPGQYFAKFKSEMLNPGLAIGGLRKFGMPLTEHDVKAIIAESHKAPYGKGTETMIDENVRKTWEIDGRQISLLHPQWPAALDKIVNTACEQMGISGGTNAVEAQLYKLLIYEKGAMFKPHKEYVQSASPADSVQC
jgi:hypothetical protein